jgi:4-hydroxyproline epimerase
MSVKRVKVVDSHTAGEPTRVVIEGGPELGGGSVAKRLERLRADYDHFRSGTVNEPRGSDVLVGALLCEPDDAGCTAGVIFFNNVGYIGMCGHGTIGLVVTLAHLGRIRIGTHRIETPVGVVTAKLLDPAHVTVSNVPSYRFASGVKLDVPEFGEVIGDVAWGGNWFFLVEARGLPVSADNTAALTRFASQVRQALNAAGVRGANGAEIDHIEVFGPASRPDLHSRSFVLCPGLAYDRSPCGTGTSAKLACLAADGKLQPGEVWRQESVIGTVFEATFTVDENHRDGVLPHITGAAYVTDEATLIFDDADPLCWGIGQRA